MTLRKITLTVDDGWYKFLQDNTLPEVGEVFRWDKVVDLEIEPCLDCKKSDMDEFACYDNRGYCLDCCGCPEHIVDEHNPSWRD